MRYVGVMFQVEAGIYRLRGTKPFGGTLYGFSSADSYGYPLPWAAYNLSIADTEAPRISSTISCSGRVGVVVTDGPVVDALRSNLSTIELDPASVNYRFDPRPVFDPGEDRVAQFTLAVIDPKQDARAILIVGDGRGNVTRDTFEYSAFNMMIAEDPTDFGSMNLNTSPLPERTLLLRNLASRPMTIREMMLKSGDRGFTDSESIHDQEHIDRRRRSTYLWCRQQAAGQGCLCQTGCGRSSGLPAPSGAW